jgi:membrane protein required for colicin V production
LSRADIIIAVMLVLGAILGYRRGFLMELFFLCAIILGVFLGFRLMGVGVEYLHKEFNADTSLLPYISFVIIFLLVVLIVSISGSMIKRVVDDTFLGSADAVAGALLGAIKYMFCASVIIWLISAFHYSFPTQWTKDSWLYPVTARFAPRVAAIIGDFLPFFKEIFKQF